MPKTPAHAATVAPDSFFIKELAGVRPLTSMDCLYVEFVPRQELKRQDRELLSALGHPQGRMSCRQSFALFAQASIPGL